MNNPNEREAIADVQRYLRQLSFDLPDVPPVPVDGIFSSETERSLRAYQRQAGLPDTGRADLDTWNKLYADYQASLLRNSRPEPFYIFPHLPLDYAIYPEEEHFLVMVVQYILNELRLLYDDIPGNTQSGVYDEMTRRGVRNFQARNGIAQQDSVDRETWNALADAYRRLSDQNYGGVQA